MHKSPSPSSASRRRRTRIPARGQLTLEQARKPHGRGGWRPGAGRPRGRKTVSHDARERFAARHPLHVTMRAAREVANLRRGSIAAIVRGAVRASCSATFRVVELNVLANHLHLIVEAAGAPALARGMKGLAVRLARRINRALGRRGSLFATRYHARPLRTPREVRNALRYVLLNARHHAAERGARLARGWLDPYSSAPWFTGWSPGPRSARGLDCHGPPPDWLRYLRSLPRPTAEPTTWLLTIGWRRHGLLDPDDVPGSAPARLD